MKLSAPIHRLKRDARLMSREIGIPRHDALDRIASKEGFSSWSLLAVQDAAVTPAARILARLQPGDMLLLGARPGQGKTLMGLRLLLEAIKDGRRGSFYTLEYNEADVAERLRSLGADAEKLGAALSIVTSDAISADYIIERQHDARSGDLIVVDYLQILDQDRRKPDLTTQVAALKVFAAGSGAIFVFISQIDRSYDAAHQPLPGIGDIRLPNPLDLALFSKACFLNNGDLRFQTLT